MSRPMRRWALAAKPMFDQHRAAAATFSATDDDVSRLVAGSELEAACAKALRWLERHPCPVSQAGWEMKATVNCHRKIALTSREMVEGRLAPDEALRRFKELRSQVTAHGVRFDHALGL